MDMSLHTLLLQPAAENHGVGSGNSAPLQPLRAGILVLLGNGNAQAAAAEAELLHNIGIALALEILVEAHHTDIGHAVGHGLGNIVIAQVKHLHGELAGGHQQGALRGAHLDAGLFQNGHGVFVETALGLYSYSQFHVIGKRVKI